MDTKEFWTSETQMFYNREKIVKAQGNYVYDENGKQYLDLNSGTWNVFLGHGRKEYADEIVKQAKQYEYIPNIRFQHQTGEHLAHQLLEYLPEQFQHVFFTSGGAEAVETSFKLARGFFYSTGEKNKRRLISLYESYHGSTLGAMSASGDPWGEFLLTLF
ncbi:MAG: aminotransferase class III-fold pyridoxal phosphate-dependent enzyme [Clostridia bacterium]|nr:aminotransferase class III-fold pyridoxal phosphate-dependent enzyme [Clostridia bacterium]